MAAGDMSDSRRHREHRQAEGQRHADKADAEVGIGSGEDGAAAAPEHQPERADCLGEQFSNHEVLSRSVAGEGAAVPLDARDCETR